MCSGESRCMAIAPPSPRNLREERAVGGLIIEETRKAFQKLHFKLKQRMKREMKVSLNVVVARLSSHLESITTVSKCLNRACK